MKRSYSKAILLFKALFVLWHILSSNILMSQNDLTYYIYDNYTRNPIPYAHIVNIRTDDGYLSNAEGLVQMSNIKKNDTIFLSHLGFVDKKLCVEEITPFAKIFLSPASYTLDEVAIRARDERSYKLLRRSKRRLQKVKEVTSKTYLSVETESHGLPIEFLQGHYNAISDKGSLESLDLKAGRVALSQINSRYFVSLSTTHLLCNYSLLEGGHLPTNPYQVRNPKRIFDMKVVGENDHQIILSYTPIKNKTKAFEGKIWISKMDYSILKISLKSNLVKNHPFKPIRPNDTLSNLGINLNITFHSDLNLGIKDMQFAYLFDYKFESTSEETSQSRSIKTNGYLFFYDKII